MQVVTRHVPPLATGVQALVWVVVQAHVCTIAMLLARPLVLA